MRSAISLFLVLFIFSPGISQDRIVDSLLQVVGTSENDTLVMHAYNKLRRATYYSDAQVSREYCVKYLEYAQLIKDSNNIVLAQFFLGNANVLDANYERALEKYLIAAKYYAHKKDSSRLASVLNSLGAVHEKTNNDSLSLHYYKEARKLGKSRKDFRRSGIASINIGNIYNNLGDLKQAIVYLEDAVQDLETNASFISFLTLAQINLAGAYGKTQAYDKSQKLYDKTLSALDTINDVYNHANILRGIGNVLLHKENAIEALPYSEKAYQKYLDNNYTDERFQMMPELIGIYRGASKYKKAFELYDEYEFVRDSFLNIEQDKVIADAVQKYETDKKTQEITQLALIDKLNRARISNQRRWIIGLVVGLGMLLLLLQRIFTQNKKIKAQKNELSKALNDKNVLLKEIHHRVKNNLQVVSSLLGLQSRYVENDVALDAIKTGRARVHSMSLLHQNLYKNENLKTVRIKKYFEELGQNLFSTYKLEKEITFTTDIDPIELDIDIVVPVGLIANELISNALKHAFAGRKTGKIHLSINEIDSRIDLVVSDDGTGIPFDTLPERSESLGIQLIRSFAEKLEADVEISNEHGTSVRISFDPKRLVAAA